MTLININSKTIYDCVTAGMDFNAIHRDPVAVKVMQLATADFIELKREHITGQGLVKRDECKDDEDFDEKVEKAAAKYQLDDEVMFSEMDRIVEEPDMVIAPGILGAIQAENYRPNRKVYRVNLNFGKKPVLVPYLGKGITLKHLFQKGEHYILDNKKDEGTKDFFAHAVFGLDEETIYLDERVRQSFAQPYAVNLRYKFSDEVVQAYMGALGLEECNDVTEMLILNAIPGSLLRFAAQYSISKDYAQELENFMRKKSSKVDAFRQHHEERKKCIKEYVGMEIKKGLHDEESYQFREHEMDGYSLAIFMSQRTQFDPNAMARVDGEVIHQVGLSRISVMTGKVILNHLVRNHLYEPVAAGTSEVQYVPLLTPQLLRYCQNRQLNVDTLKRM